MKSCPKVSVIMSCYNCENTLRKAVDSILMQTYTNWIMICCDDGSVDNTNNILVEYMDKYPDKFVVIKNEQNKKLPFSLNHCLQYVKTDLVARMDADDWCKPERFEKQVDFLMNHPEYVLVGTGVEVNDGYKKIASIIKIPEPTKETMLKQNAFSHATIMTYKWVYDELGGYSNDPRVLRVEDVDLWCRFLAKGFRGYNLSNELYVILENENAVKRRTLSARFNSAITRYRGYKLMGYSGLICYKPFLIIFKGLVPDYLYQIYRKHKLFHNSNLQ